MRIAFSIPVHEKIDVVHDQIKNISYFAPGSLICIHLSRKFELDKAEMDLLLDYKNVVINPTRKETQWGNIIQAHLSNFDYLYNNFDFDMIVFHASNDMLVKKGVHEYISNYICGFNKLPIEDWKYIKQLREDEVVAQILNLLKTDTIVRTQIEGTFFEKKLFKKIYDTLMLVYKETNNHNIYPREEIYISTLANSYIEGKEHGRPYVFSDVYFTKELIDYYNIFLKMNLIFKKIAKKALMRIGIRKDWDIISFSIIKLIIESNAQKISSKVEQHYHHKNGLYGIKRVNRNYHSPLRKKIRSLIK